MSFRDGRPCFLSEAFYEAHPQTQFPEIESKRNRPHVMFLVETENGTWFAIPLRSHIRHPYCFKTVDGGGLDYTKAIPLFDTSFIDEDRKAMIRQSDWPIIQSHRFQIKRGMERFVARYRKAKENPNRPGNANLLRFSTLQYFEEELGIE